MNTKDTFTATLSEKTMLNESVIELQFEKPEGFSYKAGQFLQFFIQTAEGPVPRSYSICSTPADQHLSFCIKLIPGGVGSTALAEMNIGDTVECKGPLGHFTLEQTVPIYGIATGAGIAPIMGIITDQLRNKKNVGDIHLLFGVRNEADIFWMEKLETLARDYENFTYTLTLSQPTETWDSHKGRVTAHLTDINRRKEYILCGSMEMVKEVRETLLEKKVDPQQIHFEIF